MSFGSPRPLWHDWRPVPGTGIIEMKGLPLLRTGTPKICLKCRTKRRYSVTGTLHLKNLHFHIYYGTVILTYHSDLVKKNLFQVTLRNAKRIRIMLFHQLKVARFMFIGTSWADFVGPWLIIASFYLWKTFPVTFFHFLLYSTYLIVFFVYRRYLPCYNRPRPYSRYSSFLGEQIRAKLFMAPFCTGTNDGTRMYLAYSADFHWWYRTVLCLQPISTSVRSCF